MPTTITRIMRDGVTVTGTSYGPEEGQPVLLFHGGGQTRHAWGNTGAALGEAGYQATAYDFRGHGDSTWAPKYDYEDFIADVYDLSLLARTTPIIVGASLGGISALMANQLAGRELSKALVLVDIAPRTNPEGVARILDFMAAHQDGFDTLEEAAAAVAAYQPHRKQRSDVSGLQKNLRQHEDGRWYWHWDPVMLNSFNSAHDEGGRTETLYQAAESLTQPVLLVRGMISDVVDDHSISEFKERIPHAQVAEVGGAGHMVAGDKNDIFLDAVMNFLQSLETDNPQAQAS